MSGLNGLETAVISAFCSRNPRISDGVARQIGALKVVSRENTGAGFFTYFEVGDRTSQIPGDSVTSVFAKIEGLANPVAFVLFIRDGAMYMLEGASVDEGTNTIDFCKIGFSILS